MIQRRQLPTLIEVDGGVNDKTIADISSAGCDIFVAGSAVFGSTDYRTTIDRLRDLAVS
jgi:ribulose-phosphate 3-epimerase